MTPEEQEYEEKLAVLVAANPYWTVSHVARAVILLYP